MKAFALTVLLVTSACIRVWADPVIHQVNVLTQAPELYGKFEIEVDLTAEYTNPFDYDQVAVTAMFTSPDGMSTAVDGFFMQDYTLNTTTGNLTPTGSGEFRIRFSPSVPGMWSYVVSVSDHTGSSSSESFFFQCGPALTGSNHGFVRTGNTNYLKFDDGRQYIPIGENIAWQNNNTYLNYRAWLDGLTGNGGNFFRLWHAHWGLGIEWKNGWDGFQGLRRYKQSNSFYQDWLFDYCAENGVYIMLALQHHGPVSTQVNPNWNDSPYNAANGGPCQNTVDFFTNAAARAHTRNRFRYIVARWGYSRAILCWELFNEVHWTDHFQQNKALVAEWHYEMTDYLNSIDPNQHIVTTSYGGDLDDPDVWSYPEIGFTQTHIYINTPNIERAVASASRAHLEAFNKPTLNGEFGLGGSASLANEDPDGIHFHNCLWGGLFGGGLGSAMTWWWDNYIHPRDLYSHFSGIAAISDQIQFEAENMARANAYVSGAPGDLVLTPTLGWGIVGDETIMIDENGVITPAGAGLGQYLYGAQWNTQYRSPPTFHVTYPAAGQFTLRTGPDVSTNPVISIWLDGTLKVQQAATPNSNYSIDVPAGDHVIKADNTGTDWTTISSYTFDGLGSQADVYMLTSPEQDYAAGWVLNNRYNHAYVTENGPPDPTPECQVVLEGFGDGNYTVRYFDPLTGAHSGDGTAAATGGHLTITLQPFLWDVAFIVGGTSVSTSYALEQLEFSIYPNPVMAGEHVRIELPGFQEGEIHLSILDMGGRVIHQVRTSEDILDIPPMLTDGLYWIKVVSGHKAGAHAIMVKQKE